LSIPLLTAIPACPSEALAKAGAGEIKGVRYIFAEGKSLFDVGEQKRSYRLSVIGKKTV
jgi:hypothetical protein